MGAFIPGATPSECLDRLDLQNRIFDDDIRLERIVLRDGKPIIVTSQPAIKGSSPTQMALDELMAARGYRRLAEGAYLEERTGLLVFDLFPRNAIQTSDGDIYPIDPVIQRITATLACFYAQTLTPSTHVEAVNENGINPIASSVLTRLIREVAVHVPAGYVRPPPRSAASI